MITRFRLENFKGHRDTDLALQQFTLLVGDNGSGKTSVLEALRLPGELLERVGGQVLEEVLHRGADHLVLSVDGSRFSEPWTTSVTLTAPGYHPFGAVWHVRVHGADKSGPYDSNGPQITHIDVLNRWARSIGNVVLYRFHSEQVAASAYSEHPGAPVAQDGAQTALALAALKLADDEAFDRIESAMRRIVPSLHRVRIRQAEVLHPSNPNPVVGSKLYFDFQGAKNVPAHHASQGTLVALALLTVLHGHSRPSVILLDDFDHSLHPRAQIELVRMIKELLALNEFQGTQIIATTYSPYMLDEVSPSDVIAFALRDDGTVASKPLSEHPDAPKVNGALKAGELWTLDAERDWVQ